MGRVHFQVKIVLGVIAILAITLVLPTILLIEVQRNTLIDTITQSVTRSDQFLNSIIGRLMVEGDADIIPSALEEINRAYTSDFLRIYQTDGRAAFSDYANIDGADGAQSSETARQPSYFEDGAAFKRVVETGQPQIEIERAAEKINFFFPIRGTANAIRGIINYQFSLESVFAQLNRSRLISLAFILFSCVVVILALFGLIQRTVSYPLGLFTQAVQDFAQGRFNEKLIELPSSDAIGTFSRQLNAMFSGVKSKIASDMEEHTLEITQKENKKYLDMLSEGVLFIGADRKITSWYSSSLSELFETKDIAGKTLAEFLYPDEPAEGTIYSEIDEYIDVVFESLGASEEMITSLNPLLKKEFFVDGSAGQKRVVIDCSFHQITENNAVSNVMVTFTDSTAVAEALEELKEQQQRSEEELALIAVILKTDERRYSEFMETAQSFVRELSSESLSGEALITKLSFIKEKAKNIGFSQVGEMVHVIAREASRDSDPEQLKIMATELAQALKKIEKRRGIFARSTQSSSPSVANLLVFRNTLENFASELSSSFKKTIKLSIRGKIQHLPALAYLQSALLHVVRNAFEHGIESPQERKKIAKGESGRIELIFSMQDNGYKIIIADDGRGIDFPELDRRARTRGLIDKKASRNELIKLLFSPGLSAKDDEGENLANIQQTVQTLEGKISVYTQAGKGTHFTIFIPKSK